VGAFKQKHEDIKDVIGRMNKEGEFSEKRSEVITGYAQFPGGPSGVRIGDDKAIQKLQDNSYRSWVKPMLQYVKEKTEEYGAVPAKWLFDWAKMENLSDPIITRFLAEAKSTGALIEADLSPNNKRELNFFIGELAYFSRVYSRYPIHGMFPKEIYNALKHSNTTVTLKDLHEWYNKEGGNLSELGFGGEDRGLLLGCGMTAEWVKKLHLSKEEAVDTAREYPTSWREKTRKRILYS